MSDNPVWIVVEVRSGIPVGVRAFFSDKSAMEYSELLRKNLNLENDETGIFQINLDSIENQNKA